MKRYSDKSQHLSIRFDKETHDKMFYIAEYEGPQRQRTSPVSHSKMHRGI